MRLISLFVALAASAAPAERRFFPKDVDFWNRAARSSPGGAWVGETPPPPGPARDLLERPTPENARRYLEWQSDRLARLHRALEALEAAASEEERGHSFLLFTRDDCPYSRAQVSILRGLPVSVVRFGESPGLWSRYGVTATPTLVVRGRVFRGLTDRAAVERAWREGDRP
jgi:hypothetical protein